MIINFDKRGGGGTITVDSALSTGSTNPVQNKVITGKINEIEGNVSDVSGATTGISADLSTVSGTVTGLSSDVATLSGTVTGLSSDVATLSGTVTGLSSDLATVSGTVTGLTSDLATVSGTVSGLSSDIATVSGSVSSLDTHLSDVEEVTARALNDLNDRIPTGSTEYIAGTNIEITTGNTINVTGITSKENVIWLDGGGTESYTGSAEYLLTQDGVGGVSLDTVVKNNPNIVVYWKAWFTWMNESWWFNADGHYYGIINTGSTVELDTVYDFYDCGTDSSNLTNPIVLSGFSQNNSGYMYFDVVNQKFWMSPGYDTKYKDSVTQNLVYGEMPTAQDGTLHNQFVYCDATPGRRTVVASTKAIALQSNDGKLLVGTSNKLWSDLTLDFAGDYSPVPNAKETADGAMSKEDKARLNSINSDLAIVSAYTIGSSTSGETTEYKLHDNVSDFYFHKTNEQDIVIATYTVTGDTWIGAIKSDNGNETQYNFNDNGVTIESSSDLPQEFTLNQGMYWNAFSFNNYQPTLYFIWNTVNNTVSIQLDLNYIVGYKKPVASSQVYNIVKLSQAEYDALVAGSAVDNNTLYVIV